MYKYFSISFSAFKSLQVYKLENAVKIFASIIMIIAMRQFWTALYQSDSNSSLSYNASLSEMLSYSTISVLIAQLFIFPMAYEISEKISSGNIVYDLYRPWNFLLMYFYKTLGYIFHTFLYTMIPSILCISLFYKFNSLTIFQTLSFILSLFFAIVLAFLIESILALLAFKFTEIWGFDLIKDSLINIISGAFLPLWMFPNFFQYLFNLLPFKGMFYIPASIFSQSFSIKGLIQNLTFQIIWILILITFVSIFFKFIRKSLSNNGG